MLIVTNGDAAAGAIRAAGIDADLLPWRDVLHDGPVPGGLDLAALSRRRARFIAACGWGDRRAIAADFAARDRRLARFTEHAELTLWFEHDLYDQLQLLQLLAWLAERDPGATRLSLICHRAFVAEESAEELRARWPARHPITAAQLALGRHAWTAFTSHTPEPLEALRRGDTAALPFLAEALERLCEEYPGAGDGLSRTARQALEAAAAGVNDPGALFRAVLAREASPFLGDASFWRVLGELTGGPRPLLAVAGGGPFRPLAPASGRRPEAQPLHLTDDGRAVLAGSADFVVWNGIDRWLGGVHLRPDHLWRWDRAAGRLRR